MRKKVLTIISSLGVGGAEKQTISLINCLDGFKVYVLSLSANNPLFAEFNTEKVEEFWYLDKKSRFDLLTLLFESKRIIEPIRPDIIYCVNLYPTIFGHLYKMVNHSVCKLVASIHTTLFKNAYDSFIFRCIYRPILKRFNHIIYVSEQQKYHWQVLYGLKNPRSSVIHNGINLAEFKNFRVGRTDKLLLSNKFGLDRSDLILCMCTTLRSEKNHKLAISAVRKLVDMSISVKLLIVGDGPMRKEIENAILRYNLQNHVFLIGLKNDVRPYIALANVFLLTSSSVETFSIAILEAMAMGKPIIAPDIGGLKEQVIDGKNGLLFEKNNEDQLIRCIKTIYKNDLIKPMGAASLKLVEQFDSRVMARKYEQVFWQILEN